MRKRMQSDMNSYSFHTSVNMWMQSDITATVYTQMVHSISENTEGKICTSALLQI